MAKIKTPAPIKVPKTPASAYNPKRRPNALILAQVTGLEERLKEQGGRLRKEIPANEGAAAAHIRQLTRALHDKLLIPASKVALTMVPPSPARKRRRKSR
jgi:hypothetical protein